MVERDNLTYHVRGSVFNNGADTPGVVAVYDPVPIGCVEGFLHLLTQLW